MEETFSTFPMQGVCNNIYGNAHEIIGWDTNKGNNNVIRLMGVMEDRSDVDNGGGRILLGL